jgi:hypothetical protein
MLSSFLLLARSLVPARALSQVLTLNGFLDNDGPGLGRHFGNHLSAHLIRAHKYMDVVRRRTI